jgi:hypothetical protein
VLGSEESHTAEGEAPAGEKKDYKKYLQHHNDNYKIFNTKSILESVVGDVKVIDAVKKDDKKVVDETKIEGNNSKASESEVDKKLEEAAAENKQPK